MDAKVTWNHGLSFSGTAGSGFTLPLGTDPSSGGQNEGFRPLELMAVSLVGCTAMDVISILLKKKQDVTDFEVDVMANQSEYHPHVFNYARVLYKITGRALDEIALSRAIELSTMKYCPAYAMLSKVFPINLDYEIYEVGGGLVKSGEWKPKQ